MTKEGSANLMLVLSVIAAVLALSAALVGYLRRGDVNIALIVSGIFILAFGLTMRSRRMSNK